MAVGDFLTESAINQQLSSVGFTVQQRNALKALFDSINSQFSSIALGDLTDVAATVSSAAADNDQLTYNTSTGEWEPDDASTPS